MSEHADPVRKAAPPTSVAVARVERVAAPAEEGQTRLLEARPEVARLVEAKRLLDGRTPRAPQPMQLATSRPAPNRTGLPEKLKAGVEALSGLSMNDVRVHRNSSEPAKLGALAYAKGSDIHLGPGQERHLAHEAWHIVQQKQGRVRPTRTLPRTPVNDDAALEREADAMGARAIGHAAATGAPAGRRRRSAPEAPAQLRNAEQAGYVGGYAAKPQEMLYNVVATRPLIGLRNGNVYERSLAEQPDSGSILNAYIGAARAVGETVAGVTYLDARGGLSEPPAPGMWNARRDAYFATLATYFSCPAGEFANKTRDDIVALRDNANTNREQLRNKAWSRLLDPFLARLVIPESDSDDWILDTNYSHSALGYITRITVGSQRLTGRIAANPAAFTLAANKFAGPKRKARYSPAHDTDTTHDVGTQIGTIDARHTHGQNHAGFDAIAKLGAEGARFQPVREMAGALKVNTRFFTIAGREVRYLTFQQLWAYWGPWFERGYGISAARVAQEARVPGHGAVLAGRIDPAHDYDCDNECPARQVAPRIKGLLDRIDVLNGEKARYAARSRKQGATADFNRGRNQQIEMIKDQLRPLRAAYATAFPPPLPRVPMPVPVGAAGGGGHGVAAEGDGDNNTRLYLAGAVLLGTALVTAWFNYFRAQAQITARS
jgi:hypothetical protein